MSTTLRMIGSMVCALMVACSSGNGGNGGGKPDLVDLSTPELIADVVVETAEPDEVVEVVAPPEPILSARLVETSEDLIGGENAYGMVGRAYILENERVRFLIQDKGVSAHLSMKGGNIIDADIARPGEEGNDQFREMFTVVGLRASSVDSVEVFKDGADGKQAILKVEGTDSETGLVGVLDSITLPLNASMTTYYILDADASYLRIRTDVTNNGDKDLKGLMVGDFLTFGGGQTLFTPEGGFGGVETDVSALISVGGGTSYGYTIASGTIGVPLVDANGTMSFLDLAFSVKAGGGENHFERYFIVGKGDVASVLNVVHELRGVETMHLGGFAWYDNDKPIEGVKVTLFAEGEGVPGGGRALTQAVTDSEGVVDFYYPGGVYDVVFSSPGRPTHVSESFALDKIYEILGVVMDGEGKVQLDIFEVDKDGSNLGAIPGKVSFYCEDAEPVWKELGEYERHGLCRVLHSATGAEVMAVKPGVYKAVVSRGIEYERVEVSGFEVKEGETVVLSAGLLRSVDTTGWMSGDFHQHTIGSIDAGPTFVEKVVENLTEGVEIAATTDHDNITSYGPAIVELGVGDLITSVVGDEVSVNTIGHFNILGPEHDLDVAYDPHHHYDYIGAKLFSGKTVPEVFADIRAIPGVKVIQINHGRSSSGYLRWARFDPVSGEALSEEEPMAWDFDSMEVKDSMGSPAQFEEAADAGIQEMALADPGEIPLMRDWFGLLAHGHPVCGMGNSDAHKRNDGVGYSRNFLDVGTDDPADVSTDEVLEAILAQRNVVSNGPFIRVTANGAHKMGHLDPVKSTDGSVVLHVTVSAPSWMTVNTLEIYASGRPLPLSFDGETIMQEEPDQNFSGTVALLNPEEGQTLRLDADVVLSPEGDSWYVFLVRGSGSLAPVGEGYPFAYTNPIYVESSP